jgi:hypothetical protein
VQGYLGSAQMSASAPVVEQVLIHYQAHDLSLRENYGQEWIIPTKVGLYILAPPKQALPRG